nr:hypothetical protein [Tanacetum cinerariifolium]
SYKSIQITHSRCEMLKPPPIPSVPGYMEVEACKGLED